MNIAKIRTFWIFAVHSRLEKSWLPLLKTHMSQIETTRMFNISRGIRLNRKIITWFLFFALSCNVGLDIAKASESSRYVDVISVKFASGDSSKQEIQDISANLSGVSLPLWNSYLLKSKIYSFLEIGKVYDQELSTTPLRDCNSESVLSKIREIRALVYGQSFDTALRNRYLVILLPKINCVWEAVSTLNATGYWKRRKSC